MTKQINISHSTDSAASTLAQTPPSEIRERPILFSGPMVKAILEGRKTQTRRVVKSPDPLCFDPRPIRQDYEVGMRLWVRETWMPDGADVRFEMMKRGEIPWAVRYAASEPALGKMFKWHPSIFMPRPACRIILEVTDVRVERINDCSEEDAKAEGAPILGHPLVFGLKPTYRGGFATRWDALNGKRGYGWEKNPWVWVIGFKRISGTAL
jgi:hypothetical protein